MPVPRRRSTLAVALAATVSLGCTAADDSTSTAADPASQGDRSPTAAAAADEDRPVFVVHRTETCECCGSYEEYLESHGFEVIQEMHADVESVKDEYGVPAEERSCHTGEIDGYFAEGHLPVEAIDDLLDERPEIDGITLGGMPAGSPGMPGEKTEAFVVATVVDGRATGELGRY